MRRTVVVAAAVASTALLLVAGVPAAGHPHATGGGWMTLGLEKLEFQAHDFGPSALDRGTANYENVFAGIPKYNADIVCVHIAPGVVRFGYYIPDTPSTTGFAGIPVIWEIRDGGSPGEGNDTAWYIAFVPPETCDTATVPPGNAVLRGNYTVHERD